ncbi:E3 ubiquitin-protein ligase CBL-C [Colossoma macropomum]|uniref:E3 ubiquitin-protein ligase CBL-C n=1 Tax=Colossoma macropomum TaxID=42526 RepID=UPI0018642395|nr:E3 ubiquitin-protein ligase CBL-C [Colossoma macropomum]XP_036441999.1 E3 ubiquitin-protein ligase CBL-C [Colossoma macropomum]XP_036442007.1 E3 ubiquitin-protein ligase CBL-C [Colossoma macropomum]XP_036442016.1 E3 ubiquitin-protein ligase CBL-C [Colossoma macropomum]XP_036442025.1 E3 ubiquitin-protein ligase CBL-C [Colossoma macropomum]XP_036442036.1 E3 ubiquitin-protein ligase CBL-C [Colossoma macropomum]XP_036442045.1 E3 ubiquitin-protein ligase CBL-C [Colossoma macropomum]XP_03644205
MAMAESAGGLGRSPEPDPSNSAASQPPSSADLKLLNKVFKRLAKLKMLCTDPRLGLKNSPPYLPELVSETANLLMEVWAPYKGSVPAVPRENEGEYLKIHVRHLLDKTDRAIMLFKEGKDRMFEEKSSYRRNLTKLTLLFSHMLWELRAMYPGGRFQGDVYKLTKTEAQEFWRRAFGYKCIVQWSNFKQQLRRVHSFEEGMEAMALKSTVDLTCNDHISIFEFDIFTRLFQPWSTLLRNWNQLAVTHPGYMAFLTYDQVIARLEHHRHRPGSYIFRLSCTRMGQWAIGHVTFDGSIVQTIPENTPLYQALIKGFREGCYLYPDGRDVNPDLTSLCMAPQKGRVKVTEEQYELYCEIGSTFQLCKICTERDKDTRIQPCGHLLCQPCLTGWQKSDGHTCPYCRCDIRGTESILIEPYNPTRDTLTGRREEEDDEDEDHEDVELVMKKLAMMKRASQEEYQVPTSSLGPPPLPPKHSTPSPCPSPRPHVRPSNRGMQAKGHSGSKTGSSVTSSENQLNQSEAFSNSEESFSSQPSSLQSGKNTAVPWVGPTTSAKKTKEKKREERTKEERSESHTWFPTGRHSRKDSERHFSS